MAGELKYARKKVQEMDDLVAWKNRCLRLSVSVSVCLSVSVSVSLCLSLPLYLSLSLSSLSPSLPLADVRSAKITPASKRCGAPRS